MTEGRVALVTGGGRGIGKAIALGLAQDGADVAINYRRDADAAAATVAEIEQLGRRARAYPASIDEHAQCEALVAAVVADFGYVDILVNNAGTRRGASPSPTRIPPSSTAPCAPTRSGPGRAPSWCSRRCARARVATS